MGKTHTKPVIDGELNDAAWINSITISDFALTGSKRAAVEPTQVKFTYDPQNLYVAWHCKESLLSVVQQRMHEVRANAKTHDADVFSDDNVLLFVQPAKDGIVYEFDLNSIGTLFDARSRRDNLWKARDASWNANAQSAGRQEDGFWTAELSVPWKAFGLNSPPRVESAWQIGLARRAVGRNEISAWNQSESTSIHLFSHWGQLIFDESVPGLSPQPLPNFEAGRSTFILQSAPSPDRIEIETAITEGNKTQKFRGNGPASEKAGEIKIPVTATSGAPQLEWNAKNQSGKYFYRSPQLLVSAESALARLKISTEKPWKLFVNRAQIGAGVSAQNQEIAFSLVSGANDIIVETQSGVAQLELTPPGFAPAEKILWRTTGDDDAQTLAATDRRNWKIAPQKNGVIGATGAPALLQHTLLWKNTLHYPVTHPAFYIAEGMAQQITFLAEGVKGIRLDEWQMSLAVPPEFEVIGSNGFYHITDSRKPQFKTTKVGTVNVKGQEMLLYHITADKPITYKANQNTLLVSFEVLVRVAKTARHEPEKEWPFYYWASGNESTVSEAPQTFRVRTLPPVNGKQPKKLVWEFWSASTHVYDDRALVPYVLEASRQAGFNKYMASSWKDFNDMVRSYGMKAFTMVSFNDGRTFDMVRPYLAAHPDERLLDKTGKQLSNYMCTTQLLGDNWPMFAKSIQDWMLKADLDVVEYDYEYPPFNPPHACFCERCLKEFRSFSKLDANLELSPAIVQAKYSLRWVDFMAYRTTILLKKMKEAVHNANSKAHFTSYSGYYSAEENTTKSRYGIDWNLVGQMQAVDEAGMGYGRPVPGVTDSIAALRGIPVKFGELLVPYDTRSRQPVEPLKRATLLRRSLDATGGVLIYRRNAMDGRSWHAIGETTRLVAEFEELFLAHKLTDIPGQNPAQVQLLEGEKQSLLCLMNETSKPAAFNLRLPAHLGGGREYYSGKNIAAGEIIQIILTPGESAVYVLGNAQ